MLSHLKNFWRAFTGAEKKLLLLFVFLFIAGLAGMQAQASREADARPAPGGEYTEGLVGQPLRINPLLAATNDIDADLSRIIFSGLLKFDNSLNLVPDMAADYPVISPDGKEFTVRLREHLVWHDGHPITSDDVIYTFQTVQKTEIKSPLRLSWSRVDLLKIDERTVKISAKESAAPFIANLTTGIIPKHIWEGVVNGQFSKHNNNLEPVGSGPYKFKSLKKNRDGSIRTIELVRNDKFHAEGPYLDKLTFKFYESADKLIDAYHGRDVQGLGYVPFDQALFLEKRPKLQQFQLTLPQYQSVFINHIKNPAALGDSKVRLALAKSVDKQKIINEVYGGHSHPAYGPILPGHLGYTDSIEKADMNMYDPNRAVQLLEESGWVLDEAVGFRKDSHGRIITLSLVTNNRSPNARVAELLKQMWESIGVQVILNIESVADLEENYIRPRNFELLLFSENVGADPDPFPFWHTTQIRDPGLNLTSFSNPKADKLLIEGRANISPEQRAAKYVEFQNIFMNEIPAILLNRSVYVYNIPIHIKGANFGTVVTPSERFADINQWHIETKPAN